MALQIDILIVICSCFAPTPSLASMVVNHFKMRTDVLSHNLSGMGCSSGVIGIDMARHYLQVPPCMPLCTRANRLVSESPHCMQSPMHL